MVKVPSAGELGLGRLQTQRTQAPFQNLNVDAGMFGAEQGRNIENLGRVIIAGAQVGAKIKDEQDKADAYDAMNKSQADFRETHYNPQTGIYTRKGAEALTAYDDSRKAVDDIYAKNSEKLNAQAKFKFTQMWAQKRESVLNGSARFEAQQRNAYKEEATNSLINNSISDAVQNYNNVEVVKDNLALIEFTLEDAVGELPEDALPGQVKNREEILKKKTSEAFDKLHTGVISKFAANGRPDIAKTYYKNVKDQISGLNQIKIDAMLTESTIRGRSQQEFDRISASGKSESEQLQMARDVKDPELRDAVEARVKASWKDPKSFEQQKQEIIKTESWNEILSGKHPNEIPLEMWVALDGQTRRNMTQYALEGAPKESDIGTYLALNSMMVSDTKQFQEQNILDYVTLLSDEDFKYFSDHKKQLFNNDLTGKNSVRTYQAIANDRLESVGIKTTASANPRDKRRVADFYRSMTAKIDTFTVENRRKPKDQEVEQIIDSMLIKGEVSERELGTGFFGTDPKFTFEGEFETFTVEDIDSVPANYRRMAKNVLERKGYVVNDENIMLIVNKSLKDKSQ
jgi:hypothetical protein